MWVILAGRGFGKTRSGAEWLVDQHRNQGRQNTALIGSTAGDVRDLMLEGESGVMRIAPPWFRPTYKPSLRKLLWPGGSETHLYTAEEPERLRGPNHDAAWCDELAAWRYLDDTWDNLEMTLRASDDPRVVVTTTPKPRKMLREILNDPDTVVTGGSTYDNAMNLAARFISRIERRYGGTRTGRQELHAEILEEAEGALWNRAWFDDHRRSEPPALRRVVVAIDPAASDTETSDETGIIAAGAGTDERGYVLDDLSGRYSPDGWARRAIAAYDTLEANCIVAERNNGGQMVEFTIEATARAMFAEGLIDSPIVPVKTVWASRGKYARAEPVSALYEQKRVSHVGSFPALEDQCCTWEPNAGHRSPDRLDALVWGMTDLMVDGGKPANWGRDDIVIGESRLTAGSAW